MTPAQIALALAVAFLWVRLLAIWRLRNWRAVALAGAGTIAILAAGTLPNPAGGLLQTLAWGVTLWVFLFRMDLVGVLPPSEYAYVEAYVEILHRIGQRKRSRRQPNPDAYVRAFDSDVLSLEQLNVPPPWAEVQTNTVRELQRRSANMHVWKMPSSEELQAAERRWLDIEQQYRDVLRVRARFWRGWPDLRRTDR